MQMHNPPHPGEILREWLTDISVTDMWALPSPGGMRKESRGG